MKLDSLKIDAGKLEQGAWVDDIPDLGDLRLKVRGLNNADYRRLQAKLIRALPRSQRTDPVAQDSITVRLLVDTILIGWENLEGETYSKERAFEILSDPEYMPFRDGVVWAAATVSERETEAKKVDSKN